MSKTYTVKITSEEGETSQDTRSLDDALDWFTNAVEAVMDPDADVSVGVLLVDGQIWGMIREPAEGDEKVPPVRVRRVA